MAIAWHWSGKRRRHKPDVSRTTLVPKRRRDRTLGAAHSPIQGWVPFLVIFINI